MIPRSEPVRKTELTPLSGVAMIKYTRAPPHKDHHRTKQGHKYFAQKNKKRDKNTSDIKTSTTVQTYLPPRRNASTQLASQNRYRLSIGSCISTSTILLKSPRVSSHFVSCAVLVPEMKGDARPRQPNGGCASDVGSPDCGEVFTNFAHRKKNIKHKKRVGVTKKTRRLTKTNETTTKR